MTLNHFCTEHKKMKQFQKLQSRRQDHLHSFSAMSSGSTCFCSLCFCALTWSYRRKHTTDQQATKSKPYWCRVTCKNKWHAKTADAFSHISSLIWVTLQVLVETKTTNRLKAIFKFAWRYFQEEKLMIIWVKTIYLYPVVYCVSITA